MARIRSSTGSAIAIHWQVPKSPRLVKWDVVLVFAIVLSLVFLAARAYTIATATIALSAPGPGHAASVQAPLARPIVPAPATVPELIAALDAATPSVRVNAAQALGSMHAVGATAALLAATYDSDVRVGAAAVAALGEIGTIQALPRVQELQIVTGDSGVEIAAYEAEGKITTNIGTALNVPRAGVQAWAVAQNGAAYAAASNELFGLHNGVWEHVSYLPDSPNGISSNLDGQTLFMSTANSGLYRSQDSGKSWEHLQFGMQTPTQLKVTAIIVNPWNPAQVYVALSDGSNDLPNSLGIASSTDGGKTWGILPDSPTWSVTAQLVLDRMTPEYLYGLAEAGPWRYKLLPDAANSD